MWLPFDRRWSQTRGFFHDGRFQTLLEVVGHYDDVFNLWLSDADKHDLVEYLKSLSSPWIASSNCGRCNLHATDAIHTIVQ